MSWDVIVKSCSIIEQLKFVSARTNCYKTILDCAEHNVKFYEKCGFKLKEVQMVIYAETASKL
jgi:glucosamine-phosphate N-acetyltransferase